jgi:excisionase family DNA binding protein
MALQANKPASDGSKHPNTPQTSAPGLIGLASQYRDLLDEREAAKHLEVSDGTLSVWRSTGRYKLPFIKIGRKVRYRRSDLDAWLESRTRINGATA